MEVPLKSLFLFLQPRLAAVGHRIPPGDDPLAAGEAEADLDAVFPLRALLHRLGPQAPPLEDQHLPLPSALAHGAARGDDAARPARLEPPAQEARAGGHL